MHGFANFVTTATIIIIIPPKKPEILFCYIISAGIFKTNNISSTRYYYSLTNTVCVNGGILALSPDATKEHLANFM